jgi:sulfur carrier protein
MQIQLNGRPETLEACTIAELVDLKGLRPDRLVVEYNRDIVGQDRWASIRLKDGDTLELLSFVGGG